MNTTIEDEILKYAERNYADTMKSGKVQRKARILVEVSKDRLVEIALDLRKQFDFAQVVSVGAIEDSENRYEVVYHLWSPFHKVLLALKTRVESTSPKLPSLVPFFESANWHERETHEMFGIKFEGHSDLTRLLLPEDWAGGYPLRKTFKLSR